MVINQHTVQNASKWCSCVKQVRIIHKNKLKQEQRAYMWLQSCIFSVAYSQYEHVIMSWYYLLSKNTSRHHYVSGLIWRDLNLFHSMIFEMVLLNLLYSVDKVLNFINTAL